MKATKFSVRFTDKMNGDKIKNEITVSKADLTKELGNKFVFIEVAHVEPHRTLHEEISLPLKAVKKLIKSLQKIAK